MLFVFAVVVVVVVAICMHQSRKLMILEKSLIRYKSLHSEKLQNTNQNKMVFQQNVNNFSRY